MRNSIPKFLSLLLLALCVGEALAQNPLAIPAALSGPAYNLTLQTGSVQFLPGQATATYGVNGDILGPTLIMNKDEAVTINLTNNLGTETTIHWHGMHVPAQADGGPHVVIPNSTTWSPSFTVKDWAGMYWYHPHLHMHTNEHVQKGIAGMIIVKDTIEAALNLPRTYGIDDFPLAIQSKAFDANNQIVVLSALDSTVMVNGTIEPALTVPAQVVRLRLLNGASERYLNVGLTANTTFYQIGSDGGLLETPVSSTRLMMAPGERADILVDLTGMQGQSIDLMSYGSGLANGIYGAAQPGMGAGQSITNYTSNPLNGADYRVLRLNVGAQTANPVTAIPSSLVTHTPWTAGQANATRQLSFSPVNMGPTAIEGPFMINSAMFDMNIINYQVPFENIEIWELTNGTPIGHPFHIHDVQFYILDINGLAPPAQLRGRKDVVHVPAGNGVVRFITKFEDYYDDTYPYMYHCHILTHEDEGMMGQFLVMPPCNAAITAQPTDQNVSLGGNAQFTVTTTALGAAYQWQSDAGFGFQNLSNAGQYSGVNTPTLTVSSVTASNNNQQFRCVVTEQSCTYTSDTAKILILGTDADAWSTAPSWVVFPNPSGSTFWVKGAEKDLAGSTLCVKDIHGKEIWQGKAHSNHFAIDAQDWAKGVYFLQKKGSSFSMKLIKM